MSNDLQRTAAWFAARTGCLTASAVADIMPSIKTLKSGEVKKTYRDARETLKNVLIAERVTGNARETFTTAAMMWGIEHEDDARDEYEVRTGKIVDLVGFLPHPTVKNLGASPDGLVDDDGLIEIKCPATHTHIKYLREGVPPEEYRPQMLLQLIVTGRRWCDFVSFDPRAKDLAFFIVRYTPTEAERAAMLEECAKFLSEVDSEMTRLLKGQKND